MATRGRHRDWFLAKAESSPFELFDPDHVSWLANELDNLHLADWPRLLGRFLPIAREQLRAAAPLPVPLLGPSLVHPASRERVAGLAHEWDVINLHPYPGGQPPEDGIADAVRFARRVEGRKPVMATESGYHDALNARSGQPPVSEHAAAVYIPRLFLEYFREGMRRHKLKMLQCNWVGIGCSHRSRVSHSCNSQRRARGVRRLRLPPMNYLLVVRCEPKHRWRRGPGDIPEHWPRRERIRSATG